MKIFSLYYIHKTFAMISAIIAVGFVMTLAYMWTSYGNYLLGIPSTGDETTVLSPIDEKRFDSVIGRYRNRRSLEDLPASLRKPFKLSAVPEKPSSIQ
jgi:hypothetical protein